jgi:quercetin dioxygenase-like cupin family protein
MKGNHVSDIATERSPYVIRPSEMPTYSPANHTGTRNTRLIGPAVNGAKYLEIALGDIERNEGSPPHAHPDLEQATYIIEGEAITEIDGKEYHVKAGDMLYYPPYVFHSIRVLTERIKLLVIYAPPYGEDPAKVIKQPPA